MERKGISCDRILEHHLVRTYSRLILDTCAGLKLFINNEWMLLCQE